MGKLQWILVEKLYLKQEAIHKKITLKRAQEIDVNVIV
jgi:hypothetical protein